VLREGPHYRVPKRDLVSLLQVLLQGERLKVASTLPEAPTLVQELLASRARVAPRASDGDSAWREGPHDDLVLATALACWCAEHVRSAVLVAW
jgi:hypothetical protein